ncbi:MAG: 3-keto-5-aminohexanoate cleavage protein [Actinobacteria bacterium]|nr:3-keto-5-aminohexanoate cleavage protein [Actinomycetota bacterium]
MAFSDPCVVTCAISGAVTTKQQHDAIPYTPEEYGKEARGARDAGAAVVHIHARTPDGTPTWEVEHYRAITDAILEAAPDIIINYSTGAVGVPLETRLRFLRELKPEMGALNMGSMNYAKWSNSRDDFVFNFIFENSFDDIMAFVETMHDNDILPEMECFDVGHVESIEPLVAKGWLREPMQFSLILGVLGGIQADPRNLAHLASRVPPGSNWEVIGISRDQWMLIAAAASLGGNVRAGLEDNFYLANGDLASGNGALIAQAVSIVEAQGRRTATPNEARELLGLPIPDRAR